MVGPNDNQGQFFSGGIDDSVDLVPSVVSLPQHAVRERKWLYTYGGKNFKNRLNQQAH